MVSINLVHLHARHGNDTVQISLRRGEVYSTECRLLLRTVLYNSSVLRLMQSVKVHNYRPASVGLTACDFNSTPRLLRQVKIIFNI